LRAAAGAFRIVWRCHTTCYDVRVEEVPQLLRDDHNQAHIARHDVTVSEVTSLIFGPGPVLGVVSDEHRVGRREFYGRPEGGRYLMAVTDAPTSTGLAYVVTARPMSDRERRAFEERLRNDG